VRELADYGLDAIECYYPKFTPEQRAYYLYLAEKYGLHTTGGSDFHGEQVKPDVTLASLELDVEWLILS
ncbi:MAG: PHP domain-containing protein, partial [Oscillospiraceae bacterium]|nr:PHP domain-containing protein [Oscillospiraceae bacterium]